MAGCTLSANAIMIAGPGRSSQVQTIKVVSKGHAPQIPDFFAVGSAIRRNQEDQQRLVVIIRPVLNTDERERRA